MEYISTTALANELDIPKGDLFAMLKDLGYIDRKNDKWILTQKGKEKGGHTRTIPKIGEFIVWPENISIDNHFNLRLGGQFVRFFQYTRE